MRQTDRPSAVDSRSTEEQVRRAVTWRSCSQHRDLARVRERLVHGSHGSRPGNEKDRQLLAVIGGEQLDTGQDPTSLSGRKCIVVTRSPGSLRLVAEPVRTYQIKRGTLTHIRLRTMLTISVATTIALGSYLGPELVGSANAAVTVGPFQATLLGELAPTSTGQWIGPWQSGEAGSVESQMTYTPDSSSTSTGSAPTTTGSPPAVEPDADWSSFTYTPSNPSMTAQMGDDGTFAGKVPYPSIQLNWGWNFSALVKATALSTVSQAAFMWTWPQNVKTSYNDPDHDEPATYTFHSSIKSVKANTGYKLSLDYVWQCLGPAGPGTCSLTVNHYFHIDS